MSLQLAAQHLASHGRGDDNVLVHMTRGELKSLNDLAMSHGGHLTINPHTGLPEAGFLKAMLPMIIGAGLAAATGGTSLAVSPMMAAGIVGAGYTAATGSVKKGLMAGLGAYGGAGMGSSLAASGTQAGTAGVATEAPQIANANIANANPYGSVPQVPPSNYGVNSNIGGGSVPSVENTLPINYQTTPQDAANLKMAEIESASNGTRSSMDGLNGAKVTQASQLSGATQNALANPVSAGFNNATSSWQGAKDFLGANKMNIAAAVAPALVNTDPTNPSSTPSDADQGQRYNYEANPTGVATGATPNPNIPSYEQMLTSPKNFGAEAQYFNGKYVNRAAGGPVEDMSTAATLGENTMYPMANMRASSFATPYQTPQSTNMMASMAPSGGGTVNMMSGEPNMQGAKFGGGGFLSSTLDNIGSSFGHMFKGGDDAGWAKLEESMGGGKPATGSSGKQSYDPASQRYASMATGGVSDAHYNLGGYSDGGRLLRGPGDGVSDDIPAMIGEKQPARLADGEFVVPARIVSELGNGSTEAGARKLYAMMDRVQSARKKTVGKDRIAHNSRADKYLPA